MKGHPYVRDWFSLLGNAAALHTIYILMHRSLADRGDLTGMWIWWGAVSLSYLLSVCCVHLWDRSSMTAAAVLLSAALQVGANILWGQTPGGLLPWLWTLLLWALPLYRSVDFLAHPVASEMRLVDMEACTLMLIVAVVSYAGGILPLSGVWPVGAGVLVTLLSLAVQRNRRVSRILTAAMPMILVGIVIALILPWMPGTSRMVQSGWGALGTLGAVIGSGVLRFLNWLLHFFAGGEAPTVLQEEQGGTMTEMPGGAGIPAEYAVAPLLILILAVGGIMILTMGKNLRRTGGQSTERSRKTRVRVDWWQKLISWLLECLLAWKRQILRWGDMARYRLRVLRNRNTPAGIFCQVEFAMKTRGKGRTAGESPRAFLKRAEEIYPGRQEELSKLTDWVEAEWFAKGSVRPTGEQIRELGRRLNRR